MHMKMLIFTNIKRIVSRKKEYVICDLILIQHLHENKVSSTENYSFPMGSKEYRIWQDPFG